MRNDTITNILSLNEIEHFLNDSMVKLKKEKLSEQQPIVKFSIPLSDNIKSKLENSLSINLSQVTTVPMRWIRGDTRPHIDKGDTQFNDTYLIYLTDSIGNLTVNGEQYSIVAGDAHIFSEGLKHSTENTENNDRLMIGPMSETGFPVGAVDIYIYHLV